MPLPTPAEQLATYPGKTEPFYEALFDSAYGKAAGDGYAAYNRAHPKNTPYQNANNYLKLILVEGLDNAIKTAVQEAVGVEVGTVQAAAKGAEKATNTLINPLAAVGDFFSRLTNPHTWLRIAEGLVGIAFLIIGLNALLKNPIGKVAGATPAGRAVKAVKL